MIRDEPHSQRQRHATARLAIRDFEQDSKLRAKPADCSDVDDDYFLQTVYPLPVQDVSCMGKPISMNSNIKYHGLSEYAVCDTHFGFTESTECCSTNRV